VVLSAVSPGEACAASLSKVCVVAPEMQLSVVQTQTEMQLYPAPAGKVSVVPPVADLSAASLGEVSCVPSVMDLSAAFLGKVSAVPPVMEVFPFVLEVSAVLPEVDVPRAFPDEISSAPPLVELAELPKKPKPLQRIQVLLDLYAEVQPEGAPV